MQRAPTDELIDLLQALAAQDGTADELMCQLRDRVRGGGKPRGRGYARALIHDAMAGSTATAASFTDRCVAALSQTYNHPPLGGAGCFAYEGAAWWLETPNPPTLAAGAAAVPRQFLFSNAGAGGARVIGILGSVRDAITGATLPNNLCEVLFQLNGDKPLMSNGRRTTFVNMANLCSHGGAFYPFSRLLSSRDWIDVSFRPLQGQGENAIIPEITFVMGPLPYLGAGLEDERDQLLEAMRGSYGTPEEFSGACREELYQLWHERDRMPAGCWSYEAPTRFIDTTDPDLPLVIAPGQTVSRRITFSGGGGLLIGMSGQGLAVGEVTAAMDLSFCSVQLSINGGENLMITGRTPGFESMAQLFGSSGGQLNAAFRQPFQPIRRLVSANDFLDVAFRSNVPAGFGAATISPSVTFGFGRLAQSAGERN